MIKIPRPWKQTQKLPVDSEPSSMRTVAGDSGSEGSHRSYVLSGSTTGAMDSAPASGAKLGTFSGVYVPCVLNIFGVILFERLGWIVGQAGFNLTIAMFTLGYSVVVLTTLSISAIVTNGAMKGGGPYFLISRAMGPEFGGAIGLIFFTANILGCAFYILGFAEALSLDMGAAEEYGSLFLISVVSLCVLCTVCLVGTKFYSRTGILIFAVTMLSLFLTMISFFRNAGHFPGHTGWNLTTFSENSEAHFSDITTLTGQVTGQHGFFSVFAVLFPAVAGMLAGVNLSGDLADPAKSIPLGTLAAVFTSMAVYAIFTFMIAFTVEFPALSAPQGYLVLKLINFLPLLFSAGLYLSTLSSALCCIIGAAKTLQAIARDNLIPVFRVFAKASQRDDEPRSAVLFACTLVMVIFFSSCDLNTLATYQTLFFLLSYLFINIACALLALSGSPNFRPSFIHFSKHTAALGALFSLVVMFCVSPWGSFIAILLCFILSAYIHSTGPQNSWGDVTQAIMYHQVQKYLHRIDVRKSHIKFWKPSLLLLCDDPRSCYDLLQFGNLLKQGGLFVVGNVLIDDFEQNRSACIRSQKSHSKAWTEYLSTLHLHAFHDVVVSSTVRSGVQNLLMSAGLGAMRPNTVLLGLFRSGFVDDAEEGSVSCKSSMYPLTSTYYQSIVQAIDEFPVASKGRLSLPEYVEMIKDCLAYGQHVLIANNLHLLPYFLMAPSQLSRAERRSRDLEEPSDRFIDIWVLPEVDSLTVNLELILSFVLCRNRSWKSRSSLRILSIVEPDRSAEVEKQELERLLYEYRVPCKEVIVLSLPDEEFQPDQSYHCRVTQSASTYSSMIQSHSSNTGVAFIPISEPPMELGDYETYAQELDILSAISCPVVLCHGQASIFSRDL